MKALKRAARCTRTVNEQAQCFYLPRQAALWLKFGWGVENTLHVESAAL
jgi:hypothetical protein